MGQQGGRKPHYEPLYLPKQEVRGAQLGIGGETELSKLTLQADHGAGNLYVP